MVALLSPVPGSRTTLAVALLLTLVTCKRTGEDAVTPTAPGPSAQPHPESRPGAGPECRPAGVPESRPAAAPSADIRLERSFGADRLVEPIGIAVLNDELIAVSDAGRGSIELFSATGRHVRSLVPSQGPLRRPMHIAASGGAIWVPEYLGDRLLRIGLQGEVSQIVSGGLDAPAGVAAAADGTLFVPDFYHHQIAVFAAGGARQASWGSGQAGAPFTYPTDVALSKDEQTVYVADAYGHQVMALDRAGKRLHSWGRQGAAPGDFDVATGIATCGAGLVSVADFDNHRVQVFGPKGDLRAVFGKRGNTDGAFDRPVDISVVGNRLYVVDFGNHRIQTFVWR